MSMAGNPGRDGRALLPRAWVLMALALLAYVAAVVGAALLWETGGGLLVGGALLFEFLTRADLL